MTAKEQMVKGPPEKRTRRQGSDNQRDRYEGKFPQIMKINRGIAPKHVNGQLYSGLKMNK